MKTYIAIITKSPWPKGRVGNRESQDWYRACVVARNLHAEIPGSEVLLTVATHITGSGDEASYYLKAFENLGVPVVNLGKGYETIEQLRVYKEIAVRDSSRLILLTTWSHYLRVLWVCKRKKIKAEIIPCRGVPRPTELITDIILTFVYPVIDLCGGESWFLTKVVNRRLGGKL